MKKNTTEASKKLHLKKGDKVMVIAGANKNKEGVIQKVLVDKQRAIVEGVNMVTIHKKPSAQNPQGGIEKKEAPIHISNLMVIPNGESKPTKIGRRVEEGKIVRYSKATDKTIK